MVCVGRIGVERGINCFQRRSIEVITKQYTISYLFLLYMRIRIENLGPVKKIDLDLSSRFLVFTGLNGTGKTYVSYVIYCISALFLYDKDFIGFSKIFRTPSQKKTFNLDYNALYDILVNHIMEINNMLPLIFNVDADDNLVKNARVSLLTSREEFCAFIFVSQFKLKAAGTFEFIKKKKSDKITIKCFEGDKKNVALNNLIILKCIIFNCIIEDIEISDRGGMFTFNKELSRIIKDKKDGGDSSKSKFPLPMAKMLDDLTNLKKRFPLDSQYGYLADKIEKEILKGHLALNKKDEVWYSTSKMNDEIPLSLASSGVKTICSIVLFLRHTAMDCNVIIIDEPEINLHPKNQILLARVFSLIVNAGIKLIINTHSDYIIREINNMIMLSSIKNEDKIKELGYSKDEILTVDTVCPYYFEIQKSGKGVVGKELEVTKTGFSIDLIDEVINDQVATSQKIYEAIED
jgi:predicted ATPase